MNISLRNDIDIELSLYRQYNEGKAGRNGILKIMLNACSVSSFESQDDIENRFITISVHNDSQIQAACVDLGNGKGNPVTVCVDRNNEALIYYSSEGNGYITFCAGYLDDSPVIAETLKVKNVFNFKKEQLTIKNIKSDHYIFASISGDAGKIAATVVDPYGEPVSGIDVEFFLDTVGFGDVDWTQTTLDVTQGKSDENGNVFAELRSTQTMGFTITSCIKTTNIKSKTITVYFESPEIASNITLSIDNSFRATANGNDQIVLDIYLKSISGQPIADKAITWSTPDGWEVFNIYNYSGMTDNYGHLTLAIKSCKSGTVRFSVNANSWGTPSLEGHKDIIFISDTPASISAKPPKTPFVSADGASLFPIVFSITDSHNNPVENAQVYAVADDSSYINSNIQFTDSTGCVTFYVRSATPGLCTVNATLPLRNLSAKGYIQFYNSWPGDVFITTDMSHDGLVRAGENIDLTVWAWQDRQCGVPLAGCPVVIENISTNPQWSACLLYGDDYEEDGQSDHTSTVQFSSKQIVNGNMVTDNDGACHFILNDDDGIGLKSTMKISVPCLLNKPHSILLDTVFVNVTSPARSAAHLYGGSGALMGILPPLLARELPPRPSAESDEGVYLSNNELYVNSSYWHGEAFSNGKIPSIERFTDLRNNEFNQLVQNGWPLHCYWSNDRSYESDTEGLVFELGTGAHYVYPLNASRLVSLDDISCFIWDPNCSQVYSFAMEGNRTLTGPAESFNKLSGCDLIICGGDDSSLLQIRSDFSDDVNIISWHALFAIDSGTCVVDGLNATGLNIYNVHPGDEKNPMLKATGTGKLEFRNLHNILLDNTVVELHDAAILIIDTSFFKKFSDLIAAENSIIEITSADVYIYNEEVDYGQDIPESIKNWDFIDSSSLLINNNTEYKNTLSVRNVNFNFNAKSKGDLKFTTINLESTPSQESLFYAKQNSDIILSVDNLHYYVQPSYSLVHLQDNAVFTLQPVDKTSTFDPINDENIWKGMFNFAYESSAKLKIQGLANMFDFMALINKGYVLIDGKIVTENKKFNCSFEGKYLVISLK